MVLFSLALCDCYAVGTIFVLRGSGVRLQCEATLSPRLQVALLSIFLAAISHSKLVLLRYCTYDTFWSVIGCVFEK